MAQSMSDVLNANLQTVRKDVMPQFFELSTTASARILKGIEKHQITRTPGSQDFRAPIKVANTAVYGGYNPAGGSLGLGGSFQVQQLLQTYFDSKLGFEVNYDTSSGTQNAGQSVVNALREALKTAPDLYSAYDDKSWHSIGGSQGIVAQGVSLSSLTLTLSSAFGADLLLPGMSVNVFDTSLATWRTSAADAAGTLPTIVAMDKTGRTATLSGAVSGLAATDKLAFPGVTATPTWMNGLYYVNDGATSGTYLGLNRATYPEVVSNVFNTGASLSATDGLIVKDRIAKRRLGTNPIGLVGLANTSQRAAILKLGIAISEWQRGKNDAMIDILPALDSPITYCGSTIILDVHQDNTRIDFVAPKTWGRVYRDKPQPDFYPNSAGGYMHDKRDTVGGIAAALLFYMVSSHNYYNIDPGSNGAITGLTLPAGY